MVFKIVEIDGRKKMADALRTLNEELGKNYEYNPKVLPFELGKYLIARGSMLRSGLVINEMKEFDRQCREIILR